MQPPSLSSVPGRPELLKGEDLPPLPRQERSRRKREALLQAGLELFVECGYEAATVEAVAHRAGVAVGGFYQHFRSKRQLLLVLMERLVDEISRLDAGLTLEPDTDPRALMAQLVRLSLSLDWAYAGVHRAWGEAIVSDAELARLNGALEDWTASLALVLFEAVAQLPGARPDLDLKTLSWIVTLLFWKLASRASAAPEQLVEGVTHLVYHALFRDAEPEIGVTLP